MLCDIKELYHIKCLDCGGSYYTEDVCHKCPHCGVSRYGSADAQLLEKKEVEINLNQLTGEVTAY